MSHAKDNLERLVLALVPLSVRISTGMCPLTHHFFLLAYTNMKVVAAYTWHCLRYNDMPTRKVWPSVTHSFPYQIQVLFTCFQGP